MRARLNAALQQLQIPLTDATVDRLLRYLDMLQRWNKVYNLTAVRDPDAMLTQHLIDCLAALPALQRWFAENAINTPRLLDVGSGGGLPGVVLAISEPQWTVDCVDAVAKKSSFIRQVAAELALPNLQGLHARVETLDTQQRRYQLITSRAFASLADFTRLTQPLLSDGAVWAAMKGRQPADELAALASDIDVFHVEQLIVPGLDAQRCVVWMRPKATR